MVRVDEEGGTQVSMIPKTYVMPHPQLSITSASVGLVDSKTSI